MAEKLTEKGLVVGLIIEDEPKKPAEKPAEKVEKAEDGEKKRTAKAKE